MKRGSTTRTSTALLLALERLVQGVEIVLVSVINAALPALTLAQLAAAPAGQALPSASWQLVRAPLRQGHPTGAVLTALLSLLAVALSARLCKRISA